MYKNKIKINRHSNNPLLRPADVQPSDPELEVVCVFNPGVFEFAGKVWLLTRVAERPKQVENVISLAVMDNNCIQKISFERNDPNINADDPRYLEVGNETYLSTLSHLRLFCSHNGLDFHPPEERYLQRINGSGPAETFGIEDCRVSKIEDTYFLTYTQVSPLGVGCGMIETVDWKSIIPHGTIFLPPNKDCALFETKIDNLFYCLNRPSSGKPGGPFIWISSSPDLKNWGNHHCLIRTRPGMWDEQRVGAGAAPIETREGWLAIYHGADHNHRYCLGAFLLDRNNPHKILARSENPIMEPEATYEKKGFFGNVIFTNGHLVRGDEIWLYYGSSDESICLAKLSINQILDHLLYSE